MEEDFSKDTGFNDLKSLNQSINSEILRLVLALKILYNLISNFHVFMCIPDIPL